MCGAARPFFDGYAVMHGQILDGTRPPRFLIWTQHDGAFDGYLGIGNEVLVFQAILLLAMVHRRALLLDLAKPWSEALSSRSALFLARQSIACNHTSTFTTCSSQYFRRRI